ncbi:hypothetical protein [Burkholderia cepacia]|uniref:hypothetical protein n=1 Tax=Burkholderia cepacia TaxID=292 RepID=UPI00352863F6
MMENPADLDKKYAAKVNARLAKLVGTAKVKVFSGMAGSNAQGVVADGGMMPGLHRLFLKSVDGKVSRQVATAPLLRAWATSADVRLKSTDDVAVIVDNETYCTDEFADDAMAFRFAELPVRRKPGMQ